MQFTARKLKLFENLYYIDQENGKNLETNDKEAFIIDEDEKLYCFENGIDKKNLEPKLEDFLKDKRFFGFRVFLEKNEHTEKTEKDGDSLAEHSHKKRACLEKGSYLFVQSIFQNETQIQKAAEALYLEAIWQKLSFLDNLVYLRFLEEDGKTIFQLLRAIQA